MEVMDLPYLNSIMFLLILMKDYDGNEPLILFKFHYVSINSGGASHVGIYVGKFKFHYVSINSLAEIYEI